MKFSMPELPYAHDALEPHMSEDVVKYHYDKHTAKYFDTVNKLIKGTIFEKSDNLSDLLTKNALMRGDTSLFNNAAQAWNHVFWWETLSPPADAGRPSEQLIDAIKQTFQSFDVFKAEFNEKANKHFGSGWVWVVYKNDKLYIKTTPNAGTPITEADTTPIMVCDLWEHAYYLQHPADKASYIDAMWNIYNWKVINERYSKAVRANEANKS